jgi:outer membrane protein insertion porin family
MGGTSYNALRGYDDGEIAPEESFHNRFVVDERTVDPGTDSTSTGYSVGSSTALYPGGKYMAAWGAELQFPIAEPLHGLFFFEAGGTWRELEDFRWNTLHRGAGLGLRMEVPLLGLIGFDYGYGFDRLDRRTGRYTESGWEPHIQFGRTF